MADPNFSGANLVVLLAIGGAFALLAKRAPTAVWSNVALARARPSSRAKRRDDSIPRRVPEVNPASNLWVVRQRVRTAAHSRTSADPASRKSVTASRTGERRL